MEIFLQGCRSFLSDNAGERALCLHERTFDGKRTSKRLCREMCASRRIGERDSLLSDKEERR